MDSTQGCFLEDLSEGMEATFTKTVTETDVTLFAGITGDLNPMHVNEEYAAATPFKGRIAHGMLTASLISNLLGTKLPGPGTIYMSQQVRFKAPVRINDTVTARVRVTNIREDKAIVTLATDCLVGGKAVLTGEAVVMVPRREAVS
ncbi:(R)-hydratase [Alkalilimnicola ehrlichii]|uniref:(R)-hydratase n=1 Tax=Alkalilimnicola ehrlichii TaxID=351052 RepID=A0A3E0X456_9GAMM|nr:MaoC family dehydratase [Alkalilimnicola ehrlichii]RFA31412.1 (R)-hydratase [Alkalilimnicola ehrlichii]RFA39316.1 (R)-hydratase [Alkalilimnicola ehrlichii]